MDPTLDQFIPVARLDEAIEARRESCRRARRKLTKADEAVQADAAAVGAAETRLSEIRTEELSHQREITRAEGLRASAQRALEQGLGDVDAAERQIARCETLIDEHETAVLELLEQKDDAQAQLARAKADLEGSTQEQHDLRDDLTPKLAAWTAELEGLTTERSVALDNTPSDVRGQYDALFARRGSALARVVDDACKACGRVVPLQRRTDIKLNRLVTCDGCARWLWYDLPPEDSP